MLEQELLLLRKELYPATGKITPLPPHFRKKQGVANIFSLHGDNLDCNISLT